jgi:hypothetical protein
MCILADNEAKGPFPCLILISLKPFISNGSKKDTTAQAHLKSNRFCAKLVNTGKEKNAGQDSVDTNHD